MCLDGPSYIAGRVYERLAACGVASEAAEYIAQKVERRVRKARLRALEERRANTFDPYLHLPAALRADLQWQSVFQFDVDRDLPGVEAELDRDV